MAPHSLAEGKAEPYSLRDRWQVAFKCAIKMALEEANVSEEAGEASASHGGAWKHGPLYLGLHALTQPPAQELVPGDCKAAQLFPTVCSAQMPRCLTSFPVYVPVFLDPTS